MPSYLQDEALPDAPDGVLEPLPAVATGGLPAEATATTAATNVPVEPAQRNAAS